MDGLKILKNHKTKEYFSGKEKNFDELGKLKKTFITIIKIFFEVVENFNKGYEVQKDIIITKIYEMDLDTNDFKEYLESLESDSLLNRALLEKRYKLCDKSQEQ